MPRTFRLLYPATLAIKVFMGLLPFLRHYMSAGKIIDLPAIGKISNWRFRADLLLGLRSLTRTHFPSVLSLVKSRIEAFEFDPCVVGG